MDLYKLNPSEKSQETEINSDNDIKFMLETNFNVLCQQFVQNFKTENIVESKNNIEEIKNFARQKDNPILKAFENNNLAYHLIQFLQFDQTPETMTCISYCLAHEDIISDYFINNQFIKKAAFFMNQVQFLSPTLTALSNIAACSNSNRKCILNIIPIENLISISSQFDDDEIVMKKLSHLLMNLSKAHPVSPILFDFLLKTEASTTFPDVQMNCLWGLHYSLIQPTNLSKKCAKFIEYLITEIQIEKRENFLYIELKLLSDIISNLSLDQPIPPVIEEFNFNLILPFFSSNYKSLVQVAMQLFSRIVKIKKGKIIEDNFIQLCKNIITESPFKIKNDIYGIISTLYDGLNPSDLIYLLYQGIVELLYDILDLDQAYLVRDSIKFLTRLVYSCNQFVKRASSESDPSIPPSQFLAAQIDNYNIMGKIDEISDSYSDNLYIMDEVDIFKSAFQIKILGVHFTNDD